MQKINSLYLHFPFCRHLCNYCDFYKNIAESEKDYQNYQEFLERTFDDHQKFLVENEYTWDELDTLYIGGGTPSLWGKSGAEFLKEFLAERKVKFKKDIEFTLEVNPGSWTDDSLDAWKNAGVNRFSLGIQSLDENFLKVIDRVHNIDDVYTTLKKFKEMGVSFSVDFILGLPFSKKYNRNIEKELKEILSYNPQHISLYILTVKDHYVHVDHLPDEEWIEKEFLFVSSFLQENGFDHYEVSNFSKPGYSSKHNLMYWKSRSVAALGPSATGYLSEKRKRYKWSPVSGKMQIEDIDLESKNLEDFYMAFRTNEGVNVNQYIRNKDTSPLIKKWVESGFVHEIGENNIRPTAKGYLMLDSLMNDLFLL